MNYRVQFFGRVQGVGFRPLVYQVAQEFKLKGQVYNCGSSVIIEYQSASLSPERFVERIRKQLSPLARIDQVTIAPLTESFVFQETFQIGESLSDPEVIDIPTDFTACEDCLVEMRTPGQRRYGYPFTHCAVCGPRWTLLEKLPYDRANTSMRDFPLCSDCKNEYLDPYNRRFHAQTMSCPKCGPHLFFEHDGQLKTQDQYEVSQIIEEVVSYLKKGKIVAIKGNGGFQLWCLARDNQAVRNLRQRKHRPSKPFALMVPDLNLAHQLCHINKEEEHYLKSPEAPIVLLRARDSHFAKISNEVAPGLLELGLMLPSSPLQALLLDHLGEAVVATSANLTDEPIAYENEEAKDRLSEIADAFFFHDRRILRPVDDSVVRVVFGELQILRLARGYAPLVVRTSYDKTQKIFAAGADLKSNMSFFKKGALILGHHLGDLGSQLSLDNYAQNKKDLIQLLAWEGKGDLLQVRDLHPDYFSSRMSPPASSPVQHHFAHYYSALIENQVPPKSIGLIWDGTGYGEDRSIWGGEILQQGRDDSLRRVGHLQQIELLGGEVAIRDPRRIAWFLAGEKFPPHLIEPEFRIWEKSPMSNLASSMGRLFDGVYALLSLWKGIYIKPTYEGECAIRLESLARKAIGEKPEGVSNWNSPSYQFELLQFNGETIMSWNKVIEELTEDLRAGAKEEEISLKFHLACINMALDLILTKFSGHGLVLAGGSFQNRILLEGIILRARDQGIPVFWPHKIPINDGGISAGQIFSQLSHKLTL